MTEHPVVTKRKLIEVALPLDAINKAAANEKSVRHGHPSTLQLWFARRPLAAARAVIFAQMVDDPSANPDLYPTEEAQRKERQRLFDIIEWMIQWKTDKNKEDHKRIDDALQQAGDEIWQSWRRTCAENADHPRADELFNREKLPAFHDPFAGGGSLPLEAQRLGLEAHASDLNPVAVLINKAMIEIPPKFAGKPPVNPETRGEARLTDKTWHGAEGLAEDVRYYAQWMRDEAEQRIGHLYPKVLVTEEMATDRPDLEPYVGRELTVIAWLWARTVKSPNPAFADVDVPLASTFILSKKKGKEAWIEPVIEKSGYRFEVRLGTPPASATQGTKVKDANFRCLMSKGALPEEYIKSEAIRVGLKERLMCIVAKGHRGRVYLNPSQDQERTASSVEANWAPTNDLVGKCRDQLPLYGMNMFGDIFTGRQLLTLNTLSDLISEVQEKLASDAATSALEEDRAAHLDDGSGISSYAEAVSVYLAFVLARSADRGSTACTWDNSPKMEALRNTFSRQAIQMAWDFAEGNPFSTSSGSIMQNIGWIDKVCRRLPSQTVGSAVAADAATQSLSVDRVVSTDPPYFDNISYADLSDFFYIWHRRSLRSTFPELFSTIAVPKEQELVASTHRYETKAAAELAFLEGMTHALSRVSQQSHPAVPITVYYAFKQAEGKGKDARTTGWAAFLEALLEAQLSISGTWPIVTELGNRNNSREANALASSIVLVCRRQSADAASVTRSDFRDRLRSEFPDDLAHLQRSNIAPVDLAQASIGPGMRIFTEYREVLNADGSAMTVREALALINATLDEVLAEQEGDFEPDSRWALTWFEQHGFDEGEYGDAEQLSKAKNTSPDGLVQAGVIESRRGKVRLYRPSELDPEWDPQTDRRPTVWEMTHHLIRLLESEGEPAAAELAASLGAQAETARDLAYRLYVVSDRKNRSADAGQYNALVQSWPEIMRLAQLPSTTARQAGLEFAEQ